MSSNKSFTLSVECPPEAVREFFEGWAKVESAKNGSSWPSVDWSKFVALYPVILPLISSWIFSKNEEQEPVACVPKECCGEEQGCPFLQGFQGQECPLKQCGGLGGLDGVKGIVISFEPKDEECSQSDYSSDEPSDSEKVKIVKRYQKDHPECDVKCPEECKKECDDSTKESEEVLEESCEQECHGSEIKNVKECLEKEVKKSVEEKKSGEEKKPKRPAYTEGAPLVMDFKNLGNAFGQNGEGFNEMVKALGPMMSNLMGGIQGMGTVVPKPFDNQNEKKVESNEKSEPAKNWSEVVIDEE